MNVIVVVSIFSFFSLVSFFLFLAFSFFSFKVFLKKRKKEKNGKKEEKMLVVSMFVLCPACDAPSPLPQGRGDADQEDRLPALLLQRRLLFLRHPGGRGRHRAARIEQRHHPAPHLHHGLLLRGDAHDADAAAARIHPDVVRHAGARQEDRGGFQFERAGGRADDEENRARRVSSARLQEFLLKEEYRALEYNLTTTQVELVNVSASWDEVSGAR